MTLAFIITAGEIVTPKRLEYGANLRRFRAEPKNSIDAVFMGSSVMYCGVVPDIITERTGKSAYLLTGPEQTFPITYAYMEEMYKTQTPKTVYLEMSAIIFEDYYENSNKINIMYMPMSWNRIKLAFTDARSEDLMSIFLPIVPYHSRWSKLDDWDFDIGLRGYERDSLKGFMPLDITVPMTDIVEYGDLETAKRNVEWLLKMNELAEKHGTKLVYLYLPRPNRVSREITTYVEDFLKESGIDAAYGMNSIFEALELDMESDFLDGMHLNITGAKKVSNYLAEKVNQD